MSNNQSVQEPPIENPQNETDEINIEDAFTTNITEQTLKKLLIDKIYKFAKETVPDNVLNSPKGNLYKELEYFQANDPNYNSFYKNINRTQTQCGDMFYKYLLVNPEVDSAKLEARQSLIQIFTNPENRGKINQIREYIKTAKSAENDTYSILLPPSVELDEIHKMIYFQTPIISQLNYSSIIMNVLYQFIILITPVWGILSPMTILVMPYILLKYVMKVGSISFQTYYSIFKNLFFGSGGGLLSGIFGNITKNINPSFITPEKFGFTGMTAIIFNLVKYVFIIANSTIGKYIYVGFIIFSYLYGIYNCYTNSANYNKIINLIHKKVNNISTIVSGTLDSYYILEELICSDICPDNGIKYVKGLHETFINNDKELLYIINDTINEFMIKNPLIFALSQYDIFKSEPSLFSNKGTILTIYKQLLDDSTCLIPHIKFLGLIDTFLNISDIYYEYSLTFPKYITNSTKPLLNINDVANINLFTKNSANITNDFAINNTAANNTETFSDLATPSQNIMLLTGPNGSGKSTYIKAVIETVLLSQTIGLSAAKNCELTPFKYISTYLNIPDCQGKESLFQAEMSRCYNMLKSLEELDKTPNQFGFNIMDEIFVSTNQYEGISGAYAIIKQLAKFGNSMHIITTHFDIITRMKNPRICKYYFTIDDSNSNTNSNNELVKTYKLNKGINKKHCALLLLKNKGFDPQIIKDANKMYRFITRRGEIGAETPRKC